MWRTSGWDDPCPFWDDDGQGYLVTTQYSDGYKINLFQLSEDGTSLVGTPTVIHQSPGSEANKLYKINVLYYHLYSEVKSEGRVLMMNRSSSLYGPYETKQLEHVNTSADREPNQGGLVQAPDGSWYFVTHHGHGAWEGRPLSLLPVTWVDGWPILGQVGADGIGTMVWAGQVPAGGTPGLPVDALPPVVTSDLFTGTGLRPQWEWYYRPRAGYWSLTERPGCLRLKAFAPLATDNLTKVGNTLTQRVLRTAGGGTVTVRLELAGLADGQHAGLCHYAATYAGLGVRRSGSTTTIAYNSGGTLTNGPVVTQNAVWLRTTWDVNGVSQFSYSLDGSAFTSFGGTYQLTWGGYRGDRIGLYTYNPNNTGDVDSVQYTIAPTRAYTCVSVRSGKVADVSGGSNADGAGGHPVARHRRIEPALDLPVRSGRLPHHHLRPQRQGPRRIRLLDRGRRADRTDDRRRPDQPAMATAPADRWRVRRGQPQQRQGPRRQRRQHGRRRRADPVHRQGQHQPAMDLPTRHRIGTRTASSEAGKRSLSGLAAL